MKQHIKISVIIPMYNSESYIAQCIKSVIGQTYNNWEIIVVDDGSTDRSTEICKKFMLTDERIRLFSQEHRGVSAARNMGIEEATGEFLLFLDSDDMIHPLLMKSCIYLAVKYCADLILCNYMKGTTRQIRESLRRNCQDRTNMRCMVGTGKETEEWFHLKYARQLASIGGKMVRKKSLEMLKFDETLIKGEDTLFMYNLVCKKIRIAYLLCDWYYYRVRSDNFLYHTDFIGNDQYFACSRMIRDQELNKRRIGYSLVWERNLLFQMEECYRRAKIWNDDITCQCLKRTAQKERKHLLYRKVDICSRLMFTSCFFCYPLFIPLRRIVMLFWRD